MFVLQAVADPEEIYGILQRFDNVLPHLKEKVTDYRQFSQKLSRYANVRTAVEAGKELGFVVFYANDMNSRTGYITLLACAKESQGQGVGRFLMQKACREAAAAGMKTMRLEVDLDNEGAMAFYHKLGFTQAGEAMPGSMYLEKEIAVEENNG